MRAPAYLFTADSRRDEQGTEILQEPRRSRMQRERQTQDQGVHQEVHAEVRHRVPAQGRHRAGLTCLKRTQEPPGSSFQPPALSSWPKQFSEHQASPVVCSVVFLTTS